MSDIIVQGPEITREAGEQIARATGGELESKQGFYRITGARQTDLTWREKLRAQFKCDINVLPEDFDPCQARLLVTDMDSTLINIECIDEIADFAGVKPQVAAITEAAMRGELDFAGSLTRRVALLAGLPQDVLARVYTERLRPNPGAAALIAGLKRHGMRVALVSGGFTFFTERLKNRLGLDYTLANVLETDGSHLTGRVVGDIVGAAEKAAFLLRLCAELDIRPDQAVAMGDGANDLKMLGVAGLGIAYRAKPKVQAQADCALNHCGLDGVLGLLGIED